MNKQELINEIAMNTGESKTTVAKVLENMADVATATLQAGEEVMLHGLRFCSATRWCAPFSAARRRRRGVW